jgi:hypothetical protein
MERLEGDWRCRKSFSGNCSCGIQICNSNSFLLCWVDNVGTLRSMAWSPNGFYGPQNHGGGGTSTPAGAYTALNTAHVLVRGTDGALWDRYTTNNAVSWAWRSCGEQVAAGYGPGVNNRGAAANGIFDVFWVQSTTKQLWHKQWDPGTSTFVARVNLGGGASATPGAIWDPFPPTWSFVTVRGTNNQIYLIHATVNAGDLATAATFSGWSAYAGPP